MKPYMAKLLSMSFLKQSASPVTWTGSFNCFTTLNFSLLFHPFLIYSSHLICVYVYSHMYHILSDKLGWDTLWYKTKKKIMWKRYIEIWPQNNNFYFWKEFLINLSCLAPSCFTNFISKYKCTSSSHVPLLVSNVYSVPVCLIVLKIPLWHAHSRIV